MTSQGHRPSSIAGRRRNGTVRRCAATAFDAKSLTRAVEQIREALKQARLAYQFSPTAYTYATLDSCLAAAGALDQHVSDLAFMNDANWLRELPGVVEARDDQ